MKTCKSGLHQYEDALAFCRECHKVRVRWWKATYPEKNKAIGLAWRQRNPEKVAATKRRHPETERAYQLRYQERANELRRGKPRPPHAMQADAVRQGIRRARMRGGMSEPILPIHLSLLLEGQEGRCRYCRKPLGTDKHLDHRQPLSRGGAHAPSNVCWSCPSCNWRKHDKTEQEFLQTMAPLAREHSA